jgi:hypothetical protein
MFDEAEPNLPLTRRIGATNTAPKIQERNTPDLIPTEISIIGNRKTNTFIQTSTINISVTPLKGSGRKSSNGNPRSDV